MNGTLFFEQVTNKSNNILLKSRGSMTIHSWSSSFSMSSPSLASRPPLSPSLYPPVSLPPSVRRHLASTGTKGYQETTMMQGRVNKTETRIAMKLPGKSSVLCSERQKRARGLGCSSLASEVIQRCGISHIRCSNRGQVNTAPRNATNEVSGMRCDGFRSQRSLHKLNTIHLMYEYMTTH